MKKHMVAAAAVTIAVFACGGSGSTASVDTQAKTTTTDIAIPDDQPVSST